MVTCTDTPCTHAVVYEGGGGGGGEAQVYEYDCDSK